MEKLKEIAVFLLLLKWITALMDQSIYSRYLKILFEIIVVLQMLYVLLSFIAV